MNKVAEMAQVELSPSMNKVAKMALVSINNTIQHAGGRCQ